MVLPCTGPSWQSRLPWSWRWPTTATSTSRSSITAPTPSAHAWRRSPRMTEAVKMTSSLSTAATALSRNSPSTACPTKKTDGNMSPVTTPTGHAAKSLCRTDRPTAASPSLTRTAPTSPPMCSPLANRPCCCSSPTCPRWASSTPIASTNSTMRRWSAIST